MQPIKRSRKEMADLVNHTEKLFLDCYDQRLGAAETRQAQHARKRRAQGRAHFLVHYCLDKPVTEHA